MNADTLLENFEILAEAPGGIDRLRELLLHLGVSGKLLPQISAEVREEILWSVDSLRLDEHRLWGENYLENSPETWPKVPLARLGSWGSGGTPTRGNKTYYDGEIPWLVIGDLNDGVVTRAANSITKKGLEESSAVIVPVGAVFVAMYGSIGKSGIAGIECATNQAIAHCVPDRKVISTEYLFLIIRAVKPRLFSQGRGLAQQNISQTVLKHLMISVPPLAEQNRIVSKIDEVMALCDQLEQQQTQRDNLCTATRKSAINAISTATTPEELEAAWRRVWINWDALTRTPESVESLRSLILDLALRGKLVEQNPSDESSVDQIARIQEFRGKRLEERSLQNRAIVPLSDVDTYFKVPVSWTWTRLGSFCFPQAGFAFKSGEFNSAERGVPLIRIRDIGSSTTQCHYSGEYREDFLVRSGDWLIGMDGNFNVRQWRGPDALLNQRVTRLIYLDSMVSQKFVSWCLQKYLDSLSGSKSYTTVDHLSTKQLNDAPIPLPPFAEQCRIVARVEELLALCDQLEEQLTTLCKLSERVSHSITQNS